MPEISRFLGIVIYIYYDEHNPPHFHAEYGKYAISVEIKTGITKGHFPKQALKALMKWYRIHKKDLMKDWELAQIGEPLNKIDPLD